MSSVKGFMAQEEGKNQAAVDILLAVKYFEKCEYHDEIIFRGEEEDLTAAYKYGMAHWSDHQGLFKDRAEMTDRIKSEAGNADYANDGCEICRATFDKD